MEKEQWINTILNSTQQRQEIIPSPFLWSRIRSSIQAIEEEKIPIWGIYGMVAVILLLFLLNISIIWLDGQPIEGDIFFGNNQLY